MKEQIIREPARVMFHLNGYTKILLERTEGQGLAGGGIIWEISTEIIPTHLRKIGSRFIIQYNPLSLEEMNDVNELHKAKDRFEILEFSVS